MTLTHPATEIRHDQRGKYWTAALQRLRDRRGGPTTVCFAGDHDMTGPISLAGLRDAAAFLSLEHQMHLNDVLGEHEWRANFDVPSFSVTGDRPRTCTAVHFLGSAA